MRITSHWINIDWQLQETLIDFVKLSGPHSGDNLREAFVASCRDLGIFAKACELANLKYKELILDVVTRWHSTYEMIMCAIECKEITVESVGRADRDMIKWVLNEEECISTNHYPTLTSTVPIFNWLIDNLEDYEHNLNGTSDIKGKVKEVIEKLKFYYIRTDASVYTIATILDPRLKLDYYRDNNWEANFINNAHQVIKDIYQSGYAPNLTNHESEYPHLALMARDYLAIPATSMPVERIFSGGTDLVTATRCSLSASTIRACMCLRYWWKGVLKNQL
ncbi:19956_t:CDS:2 [Entrophospora sp. SA101]|nr:19956_t:CDS:2 [Entrophospora sp. SA101]